MRVMRFTAFASAVALLCTASAVTAALPGDGCANATLGFYPVVCDAGGGLLPARDPSAALDAEMAYYAACPPDQLSGWPRFFTHTFLDGDWRPTKDLSLIAGMQLSTGILSYVNYVAFRNGSGAAPQLKLAQRMADFALLNTLTADRGVWPRFPRSTGVAVALPLNCSAQVDFVFGCDCIELDKGAMVAYALLQLDAVAPNATYVAAAVHIADLLAKNMGKGDASQSPWPFRVDFVTGAPTLFSRRNSNSVFFLRLFDTLLERYNQTQYAAPRAALWQWVLQYQLPSLPLPANQSLWTCFFEDKLCNDDDRVSWTSLELARYLLERRESLDADWRTHAEALMQFALQLFGGARGWNVTVMGEQDNDKKPWGGANSKLIAVAALHAVATNEPDGYFANVARRLLAWWTYFVDSDGCPAAHEDGTSSASDRGGWQEDAHTDVVRNVVDGIRLLAQLERMRGGAAAAANDVAAVNINPRQCSGGACDQ